MLRPTIYRPSSLVAQLRASSAAPGEAAPPGAAAPSEPEPLTGANAARALACPRT
jgi:hypothetical protein